MRDLSSFKSGLANTAHELRAYRGQARLTMTGDLWAQLMLGFVDLILEVEETRDRSKGVQNQLWTLDHRITLLTKRVKALEPKPPKKAKKRKPIRMRK